MAFMYYEPHPTYLGSTNALENYYFYLNQLLRVTLAPKGGYATKIVGLSRNVLARFKPDARNFCVMDFILNEINACSMDTRRQLPYAPQIMRIIEKETGLVFEKECKHNPVRIRLQNVSRPSHPQPSGLSSTRRARAARSHAENIEREAQRESAPSSSHDPDTQRPPRPSSPIVSFLKGIFNICRHNATEVYENKHRSNKIVRMLKEDRRTQGRQCSPDGLEYEDDEPPVFDNPFEIYENAYNLANPPQNPSLVSVASDDDGMKMSDFSLWFPLSLPCFFLVPHAKKGERM